MKSLKQALMAAAIGVTLATAVVAQPPDGPEGPEDPEGHMMSPHGHIVLMVRALGLNAEQKTALEGLLQGMMDDRRAGHEAHDAVRKLATGDSFDASQLEALAQRQADRERAAILDAGTRLHAFYASLTKAQKQLFSEVFPPSSPHGAKGDKPARAAKGLATGT